MRTIIQILLSIAFCISLQAENRLLDDHTLLIDSYTNPTKKEVLYYFMDQAFPGLQEPATIIIDGYALKDLASFKMCNGGQGDNYYPWHISSAIFTPKQGTQVNILANGDYGFCVHGLLNLIIDGTPTAYPLSTHPIAVVPIGTGNSVVDDYSPVQFITSTTTSGLQSGYYDKSMHGNFGITVANLKPRGQDFSLSVLPTGSITINNVEAYWGFCGIKINGYVDTRIRLNIQNFYIHDTFDGEGIYDGSTQPVPVTKFYGIIRNGILVRTGAEGIQLQHMSGMTVRDIFIGQTATAVNRAFQQFQDTGMQVVAASGENRISNIVLDGYQSIGINCFGGDGTQANNTIDSVFLFGGHGTPINFHSSCATYATWNLSNINVDISDFSYFTNTQIKNKAGIFNTSAMMDNFTANYVAYTDIEAPVYMNSGFNNLRKTDVKQWSQFYNGYLQGGKVDVLTVWYQGQVAIDITDGQYTFHLCFKDHVSTNLSPRNDPDNFVPITWILQDGSISKFPPDDYRMVNHGRLGLKY